MNETTSEFEGWGGVDIPPPAEHVPDGTDTPTIEVSAPSGTLDAEPESGIGDTVSVPAVSDGMGEGDSSESIPEESVPASSDVVTSEETASLPEISGAEGEGEESMILSGPDSSLLTSSELVPIFEKPFEEYTLSEFSLVTLVILVTVFVFFYLWKGGRH